MVVVAEVVVLKMAGVYSIKILVAVVVVMMTMMITVRRRIMMKIITF